MLADHLSGSDMQDDESAVKTTATEGPAHGSELSVEQAAQRLGSLGDEPGAKPEETAAEESAAEVQPDDAETAEKVEQEDGEKAEPAEDADDADEDAPRIPKERLDREIEKRRKATERAEAAEANNAKLQAELDSQLATATERLGVHPDFMTADERATVLRANELEARKAALLEDWDGIEDEDPKKAKTATDVRREYAQVDSELNRIGGRAETIYATARDRQREALKIGLEVLRQREASKKTPVKPAKKQVPEAAPVRPSTAAARPVGAAGERKPDPIIKFRESKKAGMSEAQAAKAALGAL